MQLSFPTEPGYAGKFVVGWRDAGGTSERVGTIVLKRTYAIDSTAHTLAPAARPLPVFQRDQPYNLVANGGFELLAVDAEGTPVTPSRPAAWTPGDGATITFVPLPPVLGSTMIAVMAAMPNVPGALQSLQFDEPLGGRQFTLAVSAMADTVGSLVPINASLALRDPDGVTICARTMMLTDIMQRFPVTGRWPASVASTDAQLVLSTASDAARPVFYDEVQLEERPDLTEWSSGDELRYEHDLVPYKPETDLIVLGATNTPVPSRAAVGGVTWLQRTVAAGAGGNEKAMFGWQSRLDVPRKTDAGTLVPPPPTPLPTDFKNAFNNGFRRDAAQPPARPFVVSAANAEIVVQRTALPDYRFQLRGDAASASLAYYGGAGPDAPDHWVQQSVAMILDTIVVEPDDDRCYVIWRGVWPFDAIPEQAYRRLTVSASA
jgi:hypothetical protein